MTTMKLIHIPVSNDLKITLPSSFIKKLPASIGLFTTTQYSGQLPLVKSQLERAGIAVTLFQTRHTPIPGQLLGCNLQAFPGVAGFVYVGDGQFHPLALVAKNNVPVFVYNPLTKKTEVILPGQGQQEQRKLYARYAAFKQAKHIGVLITTKPGQYGIEVTKTQTAFGLERYKKLEKKYPDKEFYYFIDNTFSLAAMQDFPFVEFFINTACPRIADDESPRPLLNIEDLEALESAEGT
jgi:diphthamide biosynthesis enzyme Dph1/Dph2-like protein